MASGVVTRKPPRNSLLIPSRFSIVRDLRPAAVHDDRPDAAAPQEDDVLDEGLLELVVQHGVAAVLDDDGLTRVLLQPGQRLDERAQPCANGSFLRVVCRESGAHEEYSAFSLT